MLISNSFRTHAAVSRQHSPFVEHTQLLLAFFRHHHTPLVAADRKNRARYGDKTSDIQTDGHRVARGHGGVAAAFKNKQRARQSFLGSRNGDEHGGAGTRACALDSYACASAHAKRACV